ncbi:NAD(P)/FAD-dependent oxidoreductase [Brevibacillus daliensis]|uniref:NAD(P)/FAD-dependent oxidoreductase n=1 Tax=Brevibacillus daliensis TaxID=2892995 RepID=UPI001E385DEA|nr:FAD-dependent oxidoreductase [Brevibacillus daliensis]
MKQITIIVVGGGYAGLHTVESLRQAWRHEIGTRIRLILLDKNPYHFRKVLLVKAPTRPEDLRVPFSSYGWDNVEILQGELFDVMSRQQIIQYKTSEGNTVTLRYDQLVIAVGSVMRKPNDDHGGIALHEESDVKQIRDTLESLTIQALQTNNLTERENLLHATVVGGGISGIELAAELAYYLREKGNTLGLDKNRMAVSLIHSGQHLFPDSSDKTRHLLEQKLNKLGVALHLNTKAIQFKDGFVTLLNSQIPTGLCVWTLGTSPAPLVKQIGLPVHEDGRILVDESYRVKGHNHIYSLGDCTRIIDPKTGQVDGMNCKEATLQAKLLGKIMKADSCGEQAPIHEDKYAKFFCIALGPNNGFLWKNQWGIDFVLTGKLPGKVKEYTWKIASLVK